MRDLFAQLFRVKRYSFPLQSTLLNLLFCGRSIFSSFSFSFKMLASISLNTNLWYPSSWITLRSPFLSLHCTCPTRSGEVGLSTYRYWIARLKRRLVFLFLKLTAHTAVSRYKSFSSSSNVHFDVSNHFQVPTVVRISASTHYPRQPSILLPKVYSKISSLILTYVLAEMIQYRNSSQTSILNKFDCIHSHSKKTRGIQFNQIC